MKQLVVGVLDQLGGRGIVCNRHSQRDVDTSWPTSQHINNPVTALASRVYGWAVWLFTEPMHRRQAERLQRHCQRHSTQHRSFRRRSSQPITWLILTNKTVQENTHTQTQYKSENVNKLKYSKTKQPWFSCLLQHSVRKRGGLILQCSRAHTGRQTGENCF